MVFLLSGTTHLRTVSDLWLCCRCPGSSILRAGRVHVWVWSRSEEPLRSHALGQKMNWVVKNSQFLRNTLQERVEKEAARKKTGLVNV